MEKYYTMIKDYIISKGYQINNVKEIAYGIQFRCDDGVNDECVRIFKNKKGKITLDTSQIKNEVFSSYLSEFTSSNGITKKQNTSKTKSNHSPFPILAPPLIGTDEAGKGDYFGPLCICAFYCDEDEYVNLSKLGVKDSKLLTDNQIMIIASNIARLHENYSIVRIDNRKYNDLYLTDKNLNIIMSKAHALAIKKLYNKVKCPNILTDKFSSIDRINDIFKGTDIYVKQEIKAERNLAVAAASILARATFLKSMTELGKTYNFKFPLGANTFVDIKAKEFIELYSEEELFDVAKLNFANTNKIK